MPEIPSSSETIALIQLPVVVAPLVDGLPPKYRRIWGLAVDGRLPTFRVGGRLYVRRADLPEIVRILGLPAKADVPASRTHNHAMAA